MDVTRSSIRLAGESKADGERLARYLAEKARVAEERRKLETERLEPEKVRTANGQPDDLKERKDALIQ